MKRQIFCVALAAVSSTSAFADAITEALAGKTMSAPGQEITAHADGRLTGKIGKKLDTDLLGTWEIKNGQWCRTLTKPKGAAGSACQNITMGDGTVIIDGSRGPIEYTLN